MAKGPKKSGDFGEGAENEKREKTIKTHVISFRDGLSIYDDIKLIRIKSKDHTLLIMVDHLPVIGEINGEVTLVSKTKEYKLEEIKGYYINKSNVFSLMIEEYMHAR